MNKTVNIGIIGTGGMGGRHAVNLNSSVAAANVAAIMDVDATRAREVAERCGGAAVYTDADKLIGSQDVDAILIAAPDRFHAELTRACVAAGKPVLCEKPLATRGEDARAVVDAEVVGGRRLVQVGFMRQYDPAHVAVKRVSDSGDQGKALVFRSVHNSAAKDLIRSLDFVITGSLIHDIHSARWMMDDEIARVHTAYIPCSPSLPHSARFVMIQLQYRNGALGGLECNSEAGYGYEIMVSITGETGMVQTSPLPSPVVRHSNASSQWVEEDWLQRFRVAYIDEAQAWVQSIIDGEATGPSAWDGYVSILVADASIESGKSGLPVDVDVPQKPAIYG
jgi:myo-inositol 2-dehydrogenase/D-chiro-inositol 1-dehydrogenase